LSFSSIEAAARALRRGEVTCVELAQRSLRRIEDLQPSLNAFITVTAEAALARARTLDHELESGKDRGPLHGIPFAIKDCFDTAGVRTTIGSRYFARRVPGADAEVVRRLTEAGAVMAGKANMNEFAAGTSGRNAFYGDVRNPWALERSPGGSSSGTAAALAAGMALGGVGTDCGGSIRLPAACTGTVGLRPTQGLVSTAGAYPRCFTLDVAGPMARNVRDCALVFAALGSDCSMELEKGIAGLRIGVVQGFSVHALDPALAQLAALGAEVRELSVPELAAAPESPAFFDILLYEFNRILGEAFRASPEPERMFGPVVCDNLRRGARIDSAAYEKALAEKDALTAAVRAALSEVDALVTPAMPMPTPRLDADAAEFDRQRRFMTPFSLAGLPALVLPCGQDAAALPIGMQLVGERLGEGRLFRIARAYESATRWHTMACSSPS
jgi:aspartyl-tRNA(Asn)/glutamyl-tRNA(Gln) amidotransferase subunit A